jgi:hypothetical protein
MCIVWIWEKEKEVREGLKVDEERSGDPGG